MFEILQPQVSAWDEIKPALEDTLEDIKQRRKEYAVRAAGVEDARKVAARRFENARAALDESAFDWIGAIKEEQNLLLVGGNLPHHWSSQIRNLLSTVGDILNTPVLPGDDVAENLTSLGRAFAALRDHVLSKSERPESREALIFALENRLPFPAETAFTWTDVPPTGIGSEISLVHLPTDEKADARWVSRIGELQDERRRLERKMRDLQGSRDSLNSPSDSLGSVLRQISDGAPRWLATLGNPAMKFDDSTKILVQWLSSSHRDSKQLQAAWESIVANLESEMRMLADHIAANGTMETGLQHAVACAQVLRKFMAESWVQVASKIGDLKEYVVKVLSEERHKVSMAERVAAQLSALSDEAVNWANTERAIEADILRAREAGAMKAAEKTFGDAERTVKRALATDGIFSLASEINGNQVKKLLDTLNRLLARFHFPKDFLPIRLERSNSRGKPTYRFVSNAGVAYQGLSTGQKTQTAVCWSVCLSYALRETLVSPIIAFDDFTTSLDMGQLIPAAGILRQLAYSSSPAYRRQVIVTSHHEEMTNRLVDYLLPPTGKSMKVIQFDEWTTANGPSMQVYNARTSTNETMLGHERLCEWLRTQMHGRLS
ncbi:hypothetical protein PQR52_11245 [Paraburkholderia aspalathi]|uniref:hypothetical protein n=1 Tax=Paraburkholderia aspalathi TaxID=1324617 RepID=UPI0038BA5CBA